MAISSPLRYQAYRALALVALVFASPVFAAMYLAVKFDSDGPFIFRQKRAGKDKKPFTLYKVRTMVDGAHSRQKSLLNLNEADGPVFKIRNDPRYTKVGKFLSHTGLDELPQLVNVARGEMSFVGPRPLPVEEARRVPVRYGARFSVLPGMASAWIIEGSHKLTFRRWMELDLAYARHPAFRTDLRIFLRTALLVLRLIFKR